VESDDMRANPMMGVIDQPGVGRHFAPASPVTTSAPVGREPVRAPVLGEHTEQILRTDLGLSEDQIKDLNERGVAVSASPER
jgi:2-methylfumaryl-CoA isomerase